MESLLASDCEGPSCSQASGPRVGACESNSRDWPVFVDLQCQGFKQDRCVCQHGSIVCVLATDHAPKVTPAGLIDLTDLDRLAEGNTTGWCDDGDLLDSGLYQLQVWPLCCLCMLCVPRIALVSAHSSLS